MNTMTMKLKNKKGFTLIELIVVIAILAILALIAIPRFAGFTDKAKIQADDQYASLVGNSAMTLLAAGDIKIATGSTQATIIVNADGVIITHTGLASGKITIGTGADLTNSAALNTAIAALTANKDLQYYTSMTVTLNADGVVSKTGTK